MFQKLIWILLLFFKRFAKIAIAKWLRDYEHSESNYKTIYLIHNNTEFEGLFVKTKWDVVFKGAQHNA